MEKFKRIAALLLCVCFALITTTTYAQTKTLTGTVRDEKGSPLSDAVIMVKGTKVQTVSNDSGTFSITVPASSNALEVSHVGFTKIEIPISSETSYIINLKTISSLDEVVVVGYGSVKKKDVTGAVASVSAKDFNKGGGITAADQLIQGKVAGVQMINNSGQPGGSTTVRIRGNSAITGTGQPLYIVDGVALDGRSASPGLNATGLGNTPGTNPLNFINPSDIESMDVLKDASATAIYGSRAAYGVVIITTKKGKSGNLKVDVNASTGMSKILRRMEVLNGNEYRDALKAYNLTAGDYGANVDALDAILRTAYNQNYGLSLSGGKDDARFRLSMGYQDQQGIVKKTDFKKYTASFSSNFKMLENKNLGLDINLITSQYIQQLPPITNNAGAQGSLIGQALSWNPTQALTNPDGSYYIQRGDIVNPLAMSAAYDDKSKVSNILASLSPYYNIAKGLQYRMLLSMNYSTGTRRASIRNWINLNGILEDSANNFLGGLASYANNELITQQVTHTLSYNRDIASGLNLNAVIGYEYMRFTNKGNSNGVTGLGNIPLDYTDIMQYGPVSNRVISSFNDPKTELQSYFGRATLSYQSRYSLTATLRSDGSTKFGKNNKYGQFPSFAGSWNISNESFFKVPAINLLKLRAGWGKTGNQEFPAGAAQERYAFTGPLTIRLANAANPNLKWQSDKQTNVGLDFGLFKGRLSGSIDYFNKVTTDLLYPQDPIYPASPDAAVQWTNLPGKITNKGVEIALNAVLISKPDVTWSIGGNVSFIKNNVSNMTGFIQTGMLNGPGLSDVNLEVIQNGLPLFAMNTKQFEGLDANGLSKYTNDGFSLFYLGNPNPKTILGLNTSVNYKKLTFSANLNGAFGQKIYNNTRTSIVPISNLGTKNIAKGLVNPGHLESLANPISASSRYIENGNYLKLANATITYNVGNISNVIHNMNVFFTGQNLLVITKYKGFDPEVNTDKSINGVPSAGIEFTPYPSARIFNFGINFSL